MGARQKLSLVMEGIDDFRYGSTKIVRSGRGHNSSFLDWPLVAAASFEHANYCADPIPDENVEKPATHFADGRIKSRNFQNVGRLSNPEAAGSAPAKLLPNIWSFVSVAREREISGQARPQKFENRPEWGAFALRVMLSGQGR